MDGVTVAQALIHIRGDQFSEDLLSLLVIAGWLWLIAVSGKAQSNTMLKLVCRCLLYYALFQIPGNDP